MKRRNNQIVVLVLAVFLFGFFVFGLRIVRMWGQRQWVPESAFRVLLINKQSREKAVLVIWPAIQGSKLLKIPENVYLTAVGGYGSYTSEALLKLGETEGVGERLLVDSLMFDLASPIHDVYWYSGEIWQKWRLKWQILGQAIMAKRSLIEAIELMGLMDRVSVSNLEVVELGTAQGVRQRTEVDGSSRDYLDQSLLMAFMERHFTTMWPEAADLQVAVVNASNMAQMATVWSRLARINGFDVVSVTDMPSQRQITTLLFSSRELQQSQPGRALAATYPLAKVEQGDTMAYRADVALLVGLDSWQWLNQRAAYTKRLR